MNKTENHIKSKSFKHSLIWTIIAASLAVIIAFASIGWAIVASMPKQAKKEASKQTTSSKTIRINDGLSNQAELAWNDFTQHTWGYRTGVYVVNSDSDSWDTIKSHYLDPDKTRDLLVPMTYSITNTMIFKPYANKDKVFACAITGKEYSFTWCSKSAITSRDSKRYREPGLYYESYGINFDNSNDRPFYNEANIQIRIPRPIPSGYLKTSQMTAQAKLLKININDPYLKNHELYEDIFAANGNQYYLNNDIEISSLYWKDRHKYGYDVMPAEKLDQIKIDKRITSKYWIKAFTWDYQG